MYPKKSSSELVVIAKAKDLADYVFEATRKSPKVFRFTFVSRMQNLMLDVVEQLYRANEVYVVKGDTEALGRRHDFQHEASVSLKLLVFVAEMALRQGCLTSKQYEVVSRQAFDVGNLIGGWINSDKKRFVPVQQAFL